MLLKIRGSTHFYLLSQLQFLFTTPYSPIIVEAEKFSHTEIASIPTFDHATCLAFSASHGLGVRALAIEVKDAKVAFATSIAHDTKPSSSPIVLGNRAIIVEVHLYGDVVLCYISYKNLASGFSKRTQIWVLLQQIKEGEKKEEKGRRGKEEEKERRREQIYRWRTQKQREGEKRAERSKRAGLVVIERDGLSNGQ
ncbi:hypothetical protein SLEP1_g4708 [Rubroshorea leprosula]|uniref:4-hydroxyphenylpyruvate dioxygenase n=1 Tax=Rubroshorea leprosula TaxID=152421 RepID=A0AAV5HZC3_9ROSI|nr:hypothetical protein SLEP1_g4708 [Rubroshorea leprosula]